MEPLELSSNTSTHTVVLAENERRKRRERHKKTFVCAAGGWVGYGGSGVGIHPPSRQGGGVGE